MASKPGPGPHLLSGRNPGQGAALSRRGLRRPEAPLQLAAAGLGWHSLRGEGCRMSVERLLWESDATGLAAHVRRGDLTPVELVEAAIARAEAVNPEINAIAERLYERARSLARKVDRKAPLAGVPFALKDLDVAWSGIPVHFGSRVPPFVPDFDSVLVERHLAAGLIPIATSTAPEYGIRLMTESNAF